MITILCGKSGCGKDTILTQLIKDGLAVPIISTTSRPMREKEKQDREYHFVSKETFLKMVENHQFLEYRTYQTNMYGQKNTWYYGSPIVDPNAANYAVVLDINGARSYLKHYGKENCMVIMLCVPDKIRESRARQRGSFDQIEWDRRCEDDAVKFSETATNGVVDIIVDNNRSFQDAYADIKHHILSRIEQR